jgi:cytochrome c peroxidase
MQKTFGSTALALGLSLLSGTFMADPSLAASTGGTGSAPAVPVPPSNPLTPAKIQLGRMLFMDRNLSDPNAGTSRVSCASCHDMMMFGFTNGLIRGIGVYGRKGKRNVPTVFNAAYQHSQFWDGRAQSLVDPVSGQVLPGTSLEAQALGPIQDQLEMNNTPQNVVQYVLSNYKSAFLNAFPDIAQYLGTAYEVPVVFQTVGKAVASFERTVLSFNAPYDAYVAGDATALSAAQIRGLNLFNGKGNCVSCHAPPFFTDAIYTNPSNVGFHNVGVFRQGYETGTNDATGGPLFPNADLPALQGYDLGRYYVTHASGDIGKFKTPTLRQLACTGPYMHNGKYANLRDAVEFVVRGTNYGSVDPYEGQFVGTVDPLVVAIRNQYWSDPEIDDLTSFLGALSGGMMCGGGMAQN